SLTVKVAGRGEVDETVLAEFSVYRCCTAGCEIKRLFQLRFRYQRRKLLRLPTRVRQQHDVFGLEIAVEDAFLVRGVERLPHLPDYIGDARWGMFASFIIERRVTPSMYCMTKNGLPSYVSPASSTPTTPG